MSREGHERQGAQRKNQRVLDVAPILLAGGTPDTAGRGTYTSWCCQVAAVRQSVQHSHVVGVVDVGMIN